MNDQPLKKPDLDSKRLYLCVPARPDIEHFISECIRGGVDLVQLREKQLEALQLINYARKVVKVCHDMGIQFIMNDRPDIALEVEADGVHVGQDDVPPELARKILGQSAIIGRSTHAHQELRKSLAEPVDYISAGPVVPTPTKPGREGTGIDYAAYADSQSPRPVFVTGGVTPETIPSLVKVGIKHFVVVRYLTSATDPYRTARNLTEAIEQALNENTG